MIIHEFERQSGPNSVYYETDQIQDFSFRNKWFSSMSNMSKDMSISQWADKENTQLTIQ